MIHFTIKNKWLPTNTDAPVLGDTASQLTISVGEACLTRNEDVWARTVSDSVLVSAYPLALWFATNWWRLCWEPLPKTGIRPSTAWRMAHEMGAASHGFVWPKVLFVSDGEAINIWSEPSRDRTQSVNYLTPTDGPGIVSVAQFQSTVDGFVNEVLARLHATKHHESDLAAVWTMLLEDRNDIKAGALRTLEALLGFDPGECPEDVLNQASDLQRQAGESTMSELAPVFGNANGKVNLAEVAQLQTAEGLHGQPATGLPNTHTGNAFDPPWKNAVQAARTLRRHIGNIDKPIADETLYGLLGLSGKQIEKLSHVEKRQVAVATPLQTGGFNFITRRQSGISKRFEFARFLGDLMHTPKGAHDWLASTDLATSRQKFQRAFAAEFLCPIDALTDFLEADVSESAIEQAATHFNVSERAIESLLMNNGYLDRRNIDEALPYKLVA